MSLEKRLVTVSAVVMTEETEGPEDITASYEAVAAVMTGLAERRRAGDMSALVAVEYPVVSFSASSEPLPAGGAHP